ncbi:MAG: prepilin-type N-terminal cleavage/methylation domain-containing protein [Candidatus Riflebacteria bacterium]|nr:prepilin-type N-terminal cleavage/methylation domain-containing protein [Candidatus Riflebacteria bacterium]
MVHREGFTLIELLIVTTILGVLAVMGYPKMMQSIADIQMNQSVRTLCNDLYTAQDAAVCLGTTTVRFYCRDLAAFVPATSGNPPISYSCSDTNNNNLRTFMQDTFDTSTGLFRTSLASKSFCIVPTSLDNPSPGVYSIVFRPNGLPTADRKFIFAYYDESTNERNVGRDYWEFTISSSCFQIKLEKMQ